MNPTAPTLTPTTVKGGLTGFGNLLDKELGSWWRTRRWLVHLVLWQVVISGFVLMINLELRGESTPERAVSETMQIFFQAGGFFALIGAVLVTQGAIVGEKSSGTAAWVLTKPTTRKSLILSKFVGITATFLLLALVIPAVAVLGTLQLIWGKIPDPIHFAEAVGIIGLHQIFYIAFTLMLGSFLNSRGPVSGIALGFWVSGFIIPNFAPKWLAMLTPWSLTQSAASIAVWQPVPGRLWVPVLSTAVLAIGSILLALWRFEREEF